MTGLRPFVERPVATSLLMVAVLLAGLLAGRLLPLAALPEVDYPTIQVTTLYPGASPEVMSASVTAPLEHQLGQMPGLADMSSTSASGASVVTLRFALSLPLDVAEQEVQAALNAAGGLLPADLPAPPTYRKVNPADAPVLTIAVTSRTLPLVKVHDLVESRLAPQLSQVSGVGLVSLAGGRRPAVRIDGEPRALAALGLTMEDLRAAVAAANVNQAKGSVDGAQQASTIEVNDQLRSAAAYGELVVAWHEGAPVRLRDVAQVAEDAENRELAAWSDGLPGVLLNVQRQPGANVVATADRLQALLPRLVAGLPAAVDVRVVADRTTTIRAAIRGTVGELVVALALVVAILFAFLRSPSVTLIPCVVVPVSLVGTCGVMLLNGASINVLTLMALTVATGFVVDDAIVMVENIARHVEQGATPLEAALRGSAEIGFTIVALTLSLVAVLIPLLFMDEIVGRLFHEFAVTLATAILISAAVSLTLTPMMCARLLRAHTGVPADVSVAAPMPRVLAAYDRTLRAVLDRPTLTLGLFALTLAGVAALALAVPRGLFPVQDTGLVLGVTEAPADISFAAMAQRQQALAEAVMRDPDVVHVASFIGVDGTNASLDAGRLQITLKPAEGHRAPMPEVLRRLARAASAVPGIALHLQPVQDLTLDDRVARGRYRLELSSPDEPALDESARALLARLRARAELSDVAGDSESVGRRVRVRIDREAAGRLGLTVADIDAALYDAFGQRAVSTIYTHSNQYRVVLASTERGGPRALESIPLRAATPGAGGAPAMVPLAAVARLEEEPAPTAIRRRAQFPASTISFDLAPGVALGQAVAVVRAEAAALAMPASVAWHFDGAAATFSDTSPRTLGLVAAAVVAMYLVLGALYESTLHPVTILSTLPSAALGALAALVGLHEELGVIAIIGLVLLIGLVKKNAIMMIDFALAAERDDGLAPREAIHRACLMRLRPILMTTLAALGAALPLLLGGGVGHELRRPLGLVMVAGLCTSQVLTLYSTPVIYLGLASLAARLRAWRARSRAGQAFP